MNWTIVGAFTDLAATVAVFITLIYLSVQVRTGNKQAELESLRHTLDGFNQWCDLIVGSKQTAAVLNRGRVDINALDPDERTQFDHLHIRFLNTLEGWYRQVQQTSRNADYQKTQLGNIEAAAQVWLGHAGAREVWNLYKPAFPLVLDFVDQALESTAHGDESN
ncbi:MAG: hypothetical protein ACI9ON_004329 [Limisphaerales bacterium]|jgi:hypothetical protein